MEIWDVSQEHRQELEGREGVGAGGGSLALVAAERHLLLGGIVVQSLKGDGRAGRVASELQDAESVVGFEPDAVMDVKP